MALITIITAPKPFVDPHISMIQRNALLSWTKLSPEVEVLIVGDEDGAEAVSKELNIRHVRDVRRNRYGTPLIRSMVDIARHGSKSSLLAIVNTDIILLSNFVSSAKFVGETLKQFLIVSQRWDLDIESPLTEPTAPSLDFEEKVKKDGLRHPRGGSDIFIFPRECYENIPELVVGRAGWDNWMIYHARCQHWGVVDASSSMTVIHQSHDYRHLPGGKPHYRHPETEENIRLGGGKLTIFTLDDAQFVLDNGRIKRWCITWHKFWREVEIFPLVTLHFRLLGRIFYAFFHPMRAYSVKCVPGCGKKSGDRKYDTILGCAKNRIPDENRPKSCEVCQPGGETEPCYGCHPELHSVFIRILRRDAAGLGCLPGQYPGELRCPV